MKIRPVGAELFHADGRTDIKLIVVFRNFANSPKTCTFCKKERVRWYRVVTEVFLQNDQLDVTCKGLGNTAVGHVDIDATFLILTLRLLMSYIYIYIYTYIYGAPILDVSRSHTTTRHSR